MVCNAQNHAVTARLLSLKETNVDFNVETKLSYDSQGRFTALDQTAVDTEDSSWEDVTKISNITYGENSLECNVSMVNPEVNISFQAQATVSNGYVVKEEYSYSGMTVYTFSYTYDAAGQLAKMECVSPMSENDNFVLTAVWSNGNIESVHVDGTNSKSDFTFTYTTVADNTPVHMFMSPWSIIADVYQMSPIHGGLYCLNYMGKMCSNLLSQVTWVYQENGIDYNGSTRPISIDYQFANGRVSHITKVENWSGGYTDNYDLVWDNTDHISSAPVMQEKTDGVFTLDGRRRSTPQKGVNILRYNNGAATKIYVR